MDANEIADKVREQNWKAGGHHVMDHDEAVALIKKALHKARLRGMEEVSVTWFTDKDSRR